VTLLVTDYEANQYQPIRLCTLLMLSYLAMCVRRFELRSNFERGRRRIYEKRALLL